MEEQEMKKSENFVHVGDFTKGLEGPAVDKNGNLYFVNYQKSGTIGRVDTDNNVTIYVELPEGSTANGIRINKQGELFLADYTGHNVLKINPETKEVSVHAHDSTMNQPNDLAITDDGYIYASDPNWAAETGNLWMITPEGTITRLEENMGTTNGIEVSPDNKTLYVNQSVQRNVFAYDINEDKTVSNKRLLIQFDDYGMDGMRCDVEGNLYIARYDKGVIAKVSPDGNLLEEIQLTGKKVTNIAFGGPEGKQCYITTQDNEYLETFKVETPGRAWKMLHE